MTTSVVRIARPEGWETSPKGAHFFYPQGDYKVPEDMEPEHARRCLASGVGIEVRTKASKPETKKKTGKKKPSKKRTGKKQLS